VKQHEFWREPASGRVYAVELDDGLVAGSCGPLETTELDHRFLATFDYSPDHAAWLEEHRAEFDLHQPVSPHAFQPVAVAQPALALRPVSTAMHPGVITCNPGATLREVARMMANIGIHAVVVWGDAEEDAEGAWGIVSDLDLVSAAARGETLAGSAVGAAHTEVVTVNGGETLLDAAHLMEAHRVTHLVVVDARHGRPTGVLSTLDVARALAREA
jgi:CBS domain-containing protein